MQPHLRTTDRDGGDYADVSRFERGTTWLRQVHGATVVTVTAPGEHAGAQADAAVTATPGCRLAVRTADCVPVVFIADGAVGVAHAGWRGLAAGVLRATVDAMHRIGVAPYAAEIGPHIRPGCYEFGAADLDQVSAALGPGVRSRTNWGTPALDLAAGVRAALEPLRIPARDSGACTACSDRFFSYRARGETARFATIAWLG